MLSYCRHLVRTAENTREQAELKSLDVLSNSSSIKQLLQLWHVIAKGLSNPNFTTRLCEGLCISCGRELLRRFILWRRWWWNSRPRQAFFAAEKEIEEKNRRVERVGQLKIVEHAVSSDI